MPLQWAMMPQKEKIFSERCITVTIDDESGGGFLVIKSNQESLEEGEIRIDAEEWPVIRSIINKAVKQCKKYNDET